MGFVVGIVTALLVIFLLAYITIKKPAFGETLIALSVIMILSSVFFYFQKETREENNKQRIPLAEIGFTNADYGWSYGNYYKLTADVENRSKRYRLQEIILQIVFFSCPKGSKEVAPQKNNNCEMMATREHKVDTRIAAQQSSQIETYLLMEENVLKVLDKHSIRWQIKLLSGVAR